MKTKVCSRCGKEKPLSDFAKNRSRSDGYAHYCKECDRKRNSNYRSSEHGKEVARARSKRAYIKNMVTDSDFNRKKHQKEKDTMWRRFLEYKKRAKKKEIGFELIKEQFDFLTSQACIYCGEYSDEKDYCGIDRVDPNKGYIIENCVPCCKTCNYFKRLMSKEEFLNKVRKIYEHSIRENDE